jgi:predicted nucleic acid-binding protein
VALARHVAALFPDLLPVTGEDMRRACDLIERYPELSVRDAVHAATMLGNGLKQVISVDEDFDQIREIRRVAPENA